MAKRQESTTVELPSLITREATFVPKSVDDEARTVDIVWTTGSRVLRGFFDRYWEELSLDPKHVRMKRINNGAPLLKNHDSSVDDVLGIIENATLEAKRGTATVRFAKAEDDPEADRIFRKVKDGIVQNISVGYATYEMEDTGEQEDGIPVFRATDWEPHEFSVVAMGADDGAGFRSQSKTKIPCVFVTQRAANVTKAKDKTMADENETNPAPQDSPSAITARASDEAEHAINTANKALRAAQRVEAQKRAEEIQAAKEEALEAERQRILEIRRMAKDHSVGDEWANQMIDANISADRARKALLELIASKDDNDSPKDNGYSRISVGDGEREKFVRGASAWLLEHTGKRSLLEQAEKKSPGLVKVDFAGGDRFRGLSPFELARECLERQGVKTRGMNRMEMIGLAFTYRSSYQTTGDFPTIMENVLHKILLGAYATQDTTWQRVCGVEDVADFRPANRYRTGSVPSLSTIPEHAEYKNGAIPDGGKFQISTERTGKIFSLSREAIINDDMGALANLASEFGRAAARTIEVSFYTQLTANTGAGPTMADTNPFFHSSRGNVGTGAAIGTSALDADRVLMRAQKDPSNLDFLSLSPAVLLVPDSLYGTALVINDAQFDHDSTKLQKPNMVRGLFRDIVGTPRLTGTKRYLFADPSQCAAFIVAFLQGYGRGPVLESMNGWRIDGVEWKVTQYAKVQPFDPKGAVMNAGQ